jgi:hypothetical protein
LGLGRFLLADRMADVFLAVGKPPC